MKCCLCKKTIESKNNWTEGNNAEPLKQGRCCDSCNLSKVIPLRIQMIKKLNWLLIFILSIVFVSAVDYKQEIKQTARELGTPEAIEQFVDGYIEYTWSDSRSVRSLYDIWKYGKGDCSEIAALKCFMLNAIKTKCYPVHGYIIDTDGEYMRHDWAEFKGSNELAFLNRLDDGSQIRKVGNGYW